MKTIMRSVEMGVKDDDEERIYSKSQISPPHTVRPWARQVRYIERARKPASLSSTVTAKAFEQYQLFLYLKNPTVILLKKK